MKHTRAQNEKAREAYDLYWESYLSGDVKTLASLLGNNYTQVGSVESEVFFNKKDAVKFVVDTIDQIVGFLEMRNREIRSEAVGEFILFHEQCDLYVLSEKDWVFYSKFRASSLMKEEKAGWKLVHQHSSLPDSKAEEGDNIATEKITEENLQLKEAIKRRTVELENKTNELEIEGALERVRARSMAMQRSTELQEVAHLLFQELQKLGGDFWGAGIGLCTPKIKEDKFWFAYEKGMLPPVSIPNDVDPTHKRLYEGWLEKRKYLAVVKEGKELKAHYDYMLSIPSVKPFFENVLESGLSFPTWQTWHAAYFSHGYLLSITLEEYPNSQIFERFAKVFDQAYTRFLDLQKAEEQTREAEIELALERVRSRSLAMHVTSELQQVIHAVHQELLQLEISIIGGSFIVINSEIDQEIQCWGSGGTADTLDEVHIPFYDKPFYTDIIKGIKAGPGFLTEEFSQQEKKEFFTFLFQHEPWSRLDPEEQQKVILSPGGYTRSCAVYDNTSIFIINQSGTPFSPEENEILKRFGKVFEQAYTRFLDLQKAEAQAREAQIEAALEKVRSRSLAMHKSDELNEVVSIVFEKLKELQIPATAVGIGIAIEGSKDLDSYVCGENEAGLVVTNYRLPYFDNQIPKDLYHALENQLAFFVGNYSKAEKDSFYNYVIEHTAEFRHLPKDILSMIFDSPTYTISSVAVKNAVFNINDFEGKVLAEDQIDIIRRFALVFDQAYTRFQDLQKAEAQAREAQIETALEKVRSRSLAMHKSEELEEVILVVSEQLQQLQFRFHNVSFGLDSEQVGLKFWLATPGLPKPLFINVPYLDNPGFTRPLQARIDGVNFSSDILTREENKQFLQHLLDHSEPGSLKAESKNFLLDSPGFARSQCLMKNTILTIGNYNLIPYSEDENAILKRFGNVFEQAYTRFLDLQKAEEQARESEIQLALERVRARTMAMQKSDELRETIGVIFEQLVKLNFDVRQCSVSLIDYDKKEIESFQSAEVLSVLPHSFKIPFMEGPLFDKLIQWGLFETSGYTVNTIEGDDKVAFDDFMFDNTPLQSAPKEVIDFMRSVKKLITCRAHMSYGMIEVVTNDEPISEEQAGILQRLSKVFEQTYTRFLDLKKAEAQAREAQIEAALERVRSRSMGMQKSEELQEVIQVVYQQFISLEIPIQHTGFIMDYKNREDMNIWLADSNQYYSEITFPYFDSPHWNSFREAKAKGEEFFTNLLDFETKNRFYQDLFEFIPDLSKEKQEFYFDQKGLSISTVLLENVGLYIENYTTTPFTDEENQVLIRFGKVFQQTYTRFLDLQKAEEQAREAKIETSLEKIRSRTMGMMSSEELPEVANLLFLEIQALGVPAWSCGYNILAEDKKSTTCWMSSEGTIQKSFTLRLYGEASFEEMRSFLQSEDTMLVQELDEKAVADHYDYMLSFPDLTPIFEDIQREGLSLPTYQINHLCKFTQGFLLFITYERVPDFHDIFRRFTKVFDQTYTRFLDLKKAEAQAREAQIEAALERTRTHSMLMQHSDELIKVSKVFHEELLLLGIDSEFSFVWLPNEKHGDHLFWTTWVEEENGKETFKTNSITYPLDKTERYTAACFDAWASGIPVHEYFVPSAEVEEFFEAWTELLEGAENLKPEKFPNGIYYTEAYMKYGCFGIDIRRPLRDEEKKVLHRFAVQFERTYTRFLDLQKAEARARESQIETALERVRSRTMGMQQSEELGEVATVLFNEMNGLVDDLWTCGFVLCEENRKEDEWWLSMDDGFSRGFFLPNVGDFAHETLYEGWEKGESFRSVELDGKKLNDHYEWLMKLPIAKQIFEDMEASGIPRPKWQKLHAAYFKTGYLVIITEVPCEEEEIFKRFAQVFDLTYTRFLDLQQKEEQGKKLIEEKLRLEQTLRDLKSTQAQLIQSEKMASLGELTAGIAHEIQNPLNFVNNFSEVSTELVDEMKEELAAGSVEFAVEIADDLKQNLEKINHHGKRADAIVKGMLEHSRINKGEKALTDLNALADEFVRLSYHGLRAKDKSFNADFKIDLDPNLPKVNVVAPDMGRVILNLVNNAFYAVDEKAKSGNVDANYKPTVLVSSSYSPLESLSPDIGRGEGSIQISVKDNGGGIPEQVREKIFQPFFTTKPTGSGTGLGLSLSYDIVKAHGGELHVSSTMGEGLPSSEAGTEMSIVLRIDPDMK